jgi:hypothetical protein
LPPVFTRAEAHRAGASKRQLYSWRDSGQIEALGRGLFMRAGTGGDLDFVEIAARAPTATLCLASALARHDLIDFIPETIHVALERSRRAPRTAAPVTWHRFDEATFRIDRDEFEVAPRYRLGVYGPTRSVVDTFRLRHLEGSDAAIEALRRWLRRRGNHPAKLLEMARHFPRTVNTIQNALEILL